jgi:hypothetical protein
MAALRYRLQRDVRYRRILGEAVVIRQEASEVLGVNEVGATILDGLREGADAAALAGRVAEAFEVDAAKAERHVGEFLAELAKIGVVEPAGE